MNEDKMDVIIANQRRIIELLEAGNRRAAAEEQPSAFQEEVRRMRGLGRSMDEIRALAVACGKVKPKREYKRKEGRA